MTEEEISIQCARAALVFRRLKRIMFEVETDIDAERRQTPVLTPAIVRDRIGLLEGRQKLYEECIDPSWTEARRRDYAVSNLISFFRQFDNPMLGSNKWYQEIESLLRELEDVVRRFESHTSR